MYTGNEVGTGFNWFEIRTNGELYEHGDEPFDPPKAGVS
jgi:hypothetical protein